MEIQPIDLTAVLGVTLGMLTVLIPVSGLTLRFALKPVVEALALARGRSSAREEITLLEKRIELLERELQLRRLPASTGEAVGGSVSSLRTLDRA